MPAVWRIDIRLGQGDDAALVRSEQVEGDTEEAALRTLADRLAQDGEEPLCDGQEEISSEGEFAFGSRMPPLEMRAETSDPYATDERPKA